MREVRGFDLRNLRLKLRDPALEDASAALYLALQQSHDSSLDALLELRPDITEVGKRLIAAILLELEFHSKSSQRYPEPKDDWLTLFFGELTGRTTSLEDFAKNPVVLITYNYDRLIEHRLCGALMAHYGRSRDDCIRVLRQLQIIHLHGDLGPLPGFAAEGAVEFGPSMGTEADFAAAITRAMSRIVVVHEAKDETEDFDRARKALQSADQIVMLGFGYGERNLSRLDIKRWKRAKHLWGTTYRLTPSQVAYLVARPFEAVGLRVITGPADYGTRQYFENNLAIFRDP
jgi:hypothetical protein